MSYRDCCGKLAMGSSASGSALNNRQNYIKNESNRLDPEVQMSCPNTRHVAESG